MFSVKVRAQHPRGSRAVRIAGTERLELHELSGRCLHEYTISDQNLKSTENCGILLKKVLKSPLNACLRAMHDTTIESEMA